jgi:hypothetical protein
VALALVAPPAAVAQSTPSPAPSQGGGSSPFAPLPPAQPSQPSEPAPQQPKPASNSSDDGPSDRSMFLLGAGGIVLIVVIGVLIGRDARRTLPPGHRPRKPGAKPPRPEPPKVHRGHPAGRRRDAKASAPPKRRAKRRAR